MNPHPNSQPQTPPPPCPSWPVIEGRLQTGGMDAYLCAIKTVYDWCQTLSAQVNELRQAVGSRPMLPGSIPETGVIHMPSSAIDARLSGEES